MQYRKQRRSAVIIGLALLGMVPASATAEEATQLIRVRADALSDILANGVEPLRILDYGSFVWLEVDAGNAALAPRAVYAREVRTDPFTLRLGEQSFDLADAEPKLPKGWKVVEESGPDLRIVQMVGPSRSAWVDSLESSGLEIVAYIQPYSYIVWADRQAQEAVRGTDIVRAVGTFDPAFRVLPQYRSLTVAPVAANIMVYRGADTDAVARRLKALGAKIDRREVVSRTFEIIGVTLPGSRFEAVGRIPGVYTVQPHRKDGGLRGEMSNQVNVNNVDRFNVAFPGYQTWLNSVSLSGAGVIMANVDGGVQNDHPDLVGRLLPCAGSTCGGSQTDAHGTHTAGIMAADGASGTTDSLGFIRGLGVAPGASLVEQVYSPTFTQPGGMLKLMTQSSQNDALLSGNSWGPSGTPQGYDNDTYQVDVGVRDAEPLVAGNQAFTYVLSIMNGNGGTSSQGTPDEAKNIFTIGSTKMQTGGGAPITDLDDISPNSAHGPALDGRKIPHMVAPGCSVDSTTSGSSYITLCGTSMASPHVSGAVALFIEYYRSLPDYAADPSPALVKAVFLAAARDLAGNRDADGGILGHRFDSKQGWGRMDLEAVVDPIYSVRYYDNPMVFDNTGEEWVETVSPLDPNRPMKLMLVWTDAPGHGLGGSTPAWNNDLDLAVDVGADTYWGNNFDANGWSQPGGFSDGRNNTEGVFFGPTSPASITVRVIAANINSDGIPGEGDGTDQDFALVCYNCALEPGFTLAVAPNAAEVCAPDDVVFSVDVGQIIDYAEPVTLSATGAPAGTTLGFAANPITPPGSTTMTVSNTGAAAPGSYSITIVAANADAQHEVAVSLELFSMVPAAVTLLAPPDADTELSITPTLTWAVASQATSYQIEVATDSNFNDIVYNALSDATSHQVGSPLDIATQYYWRARATNACGVGDDSTTFSFATRDVPPVLLVDDDDNDPDVRATYEAALTAIGQDYDVWDTVNSDNEPDANTLAAYDMIVWFTGAEFGGSAGPGVTGEAALSTYLDGGGCVFVSAQDYHFDRGLTSFMQNYLGVGSASNDVAQTTVTGDGPVFGGVGAIALSYPFSNYSDTISPGGVGQLAFSGNQGDAAVTVDDSTFRTVFWGFPFEALPTEQDREDVMRIVVNYCNRQVADCNSNGIPDADEIASGDAEDCNDNLVPDQCDIAFGSSSDDDANGIPDECDPDVPLAADDVPKNRYISFDPNHAGTTVAFQVNLSSSDLFPGTAVTAWVDATDANGVARLVTDPVFLSDWPADVHVGDCRIVPATTYEVRASADGTSFSAPLLVSTTPKPTDGFWADCVGSFAESWSGPNGVVNFQDIAATIQRFQGEPFAPPTTWVDLHGETPNFVINFADIDAVVGGFLGDFYPYRDPADCPG